MNQFIERQVGPREPWLNKRELAGHLGVSTRTIERLNFPGVQVGGQKRYLASEVEAVLKGTALLPSSHDLPHQSGSCCRSNDQSIPHKKAK